MQFESECIIAVEAVTEAATQTKRRRVLTLARETILSLRSGIRAGMEQQNPSVKTAKAGCTK